MNSLHSLAKSFKFAFRGLSFCICSQRNFRIHIVAALCVSLLSLFYSFSPAQASLLAITISLVLLCEIFNTALELLSDGYRCSFDRQVMHIKDLASGAVLIASLASVIVAILLFSDLKGLTALYRFFICTPLRLLYLIPLVAFSVFFIFAPGKKH